MRLARAIGIATLLCSVSARAQTPLDRYWPHAPGDSWTYDRVSIEWNATAAPQAASARFEFGAPRLAGAVLVQSLDVTVGGTAVPPQATFLWQLAAAHPELRSGPLDTRGMAPGGGLGLTIYDAALVRVGDDEIAAYRDSPAIRSWIYLMPNPVTGQSFHLQLVPDLADSVFLDGTVLGTADISTPAGTFDGAVRVRYHIDYGWSDERDEGGNLLGRVRSRTRGELFWEAAVGPVLARETFVAQSEVQGSPPPPPVDSTFAELRLQSYSLQPTAVRPLAWSAMKRLYSPSDPRRPQSPH